MWKIKETENDIGSCIYSAYTDLEIYYHKCDKHGIENTKHLNVVSSVVNGTVITDTIYRIVQLCTFWAKQGKHNNTMKTLGIGLTCFPIIYWTFPVPPMLNFRHLKNRLHIILF